MGEKRAFGCRRFYSLALTYESSNFTLQPYTQMYSKLPHLLDILAQTDNTFLHKNRTITELVFPDKSVQCLLWINMFIIMNFIYNNAFFAFKKYDCVYTS